MLVAHVELSAEMIRACNSSLVLLKFALKGCSQRTMLMQQLRQLVIAQNLHSEHGALVLPA